MSHSPCYPEPYEWGSPIAPPHPRGWYVPLYQAMDAIGRSRVFPATWMQCAGRIIKGDCWHWSDFDLAMQYLVGAFDWAPDRLRTGTGVTYDAELSDLSGFPPPDGVHRYRWWWTNFYDAARPGKWICLLFDVVVGPNVYELPSLTPILFATSRYFGLTIHTDGLCIPDTGDFNLPSAPWLNAV